MQIFDGVANFIILSLFAILLIALLVAIFKCLKAFRVERLKNELIIKRNYADIFISSLNGKFDRELIKSQLIDIFQKEKIPFTHEEIDKLIEAAKQEYLKGE